MEIICTTSAERYRDYRLATQNCWTFNRVDTQAWYAQIFEAVGVKRVKLLNIHCAVDGGATDEDLFMLANSIKTNDTLESLSLRYFVEDVSLGMTAVLAALTNKPKISEIGLSFLFQTAQVWTALLDFLRAHPHLKQLSLYNSNLSEDQMIELMAVLIEYNNELKLLNLGGDWNSNTLESLKAVARYVSKSTDLAELVLNEDEDFKEEVADQVIAIMQNNTSVVTLHPSNGFFGNSDWFIRNCTAEQEQDALVFQEQLRLAQSDKVPNTPTEAILLPDSTGKDAINTLSGEILCEILWQLSIKSVCALRQVNWRFYTVTKESNFWRVYYTKYFSCIPRDVLMLTELTFGVKLATGSMTEKLTTTLWEEIFINSYRARNISPEDYPIKCGLPFMEPVYRQYPQLVGTKESAGVYTDNRIFRYKDLPYQQTWFLMYASHAAIYHLGFEQLADGRRNGILILTPDFSESFENRFKYLSHVFDWFSANTDAEFAEKSQALCNAYLASHNANNVGFVSGRCYTKIEPLLGDAIKARQKMSEELRVEIESAAKDHVTKFYSTNPSPESTSAFVQRVQHLINQFKEGKNDSTQHFTDLERLTQKMPPRSVTNTKYPDDADENRFYHFAWHNWYEQREAQAPAQSDQQPQVDRSKPIPTVVVAKFYRVAINFIMMPVLKTFWPGDMDHPDYELPPFLRWQKNSMSLFKKLYYSSGPYVPFSQVSVSKAHPSKWPLIAIGLARRLLPLIICALADILDGSNGSANIDKLIGVLSKLPMMSKHVTLSLRSFVEEKK